jgi:YesN/AraC family two-component response regulator
VKEFLVAGSWQRWHADLELFQQCEAHIVRTNITMPDMECILMALEIRMLSSVAHIMRIGFQF